jgi:hypothetical protein
MALPFLGSCLPRFDAPVVSWPVASATPQLIRDGVEAADLVVLATPDSMEADNAMTADLTIGFKPSWWNIRLTVDSVARGKLRWAKRVDYGELPAYATPPSWHLAGNQILVQVSTGWQTAPVNLGTKAVYFLKKCYNCVALPTHTQARYFASPWFSILTLTPEQFSVIPKEGS